MLNWHALELMRQERYDALMREAERQRLLDALSETRPGIHRTPRQLGWLLIRVGNWLVAQGVRIHPCGAEALPSASLAATVSTPSPTFWTHVAPSNPASRNGYRRDDR